MNHNAPGFLCIAPEIEKFPDVNYVNISAYISIHALLQSTSDPTLALLFLDPTETPDHQ